MMILRCFHTARPIFNAAAAVEKSALAKLRKNTGYSFSKCKEALEKHSNDLKEAEKWLKAQAQAHGWEKATKLQGRATAQGLISVLATPNNAVMVETNCETDFVSRNKKFQSLVHKVTQGCYDYSKGQGNHTGNTFLTSAPVSSEQLANLPLAGSKPVKDETALSIGELGENIQNRRAICFQASAPVILAGYTHPLPEAGVLPDKESIQSGRYGVIVAYRPIVGSSGGQKQAQLDDIGRQLCQHIVGMNPTEIGTLKQVEHAPEAPAAAEEATTKSDDVDPENLEAKQLYPDDDESSLLNQEFLLDPDLRVGEYLLENGIEVLDFARYECGEKIKSAQQE